MGEISRKHLLRRSSNKTGWSDDPPLYLSFLLSNTLQARSREKHQMDKIAPWLQELTKCISAFSSSSSFFPFSFPFSRNALRLCGNERLWRHPRNPLLLSQRPLRNLSHRNPRLHFFLHAGVPIAKVSSRRSWSSVASNSNQEIPENPEKIALN